VTTRYERMLQRRMQQRIQLVVEERRLSLARPDNHAEQAVDPEATIEIPAQSSLRAIGRVTVRSA